MRKRNVLIAACICICTWATAQKRNSNIQLGAETGIPFHTYGLGFGGFIKGLYGTGKSGQLTLSAGLTKFFNSKRMVYTPERTTRLVSFMLGYKQHVSHFYLEPQVGLGELGGKYALIGDYSRQSVAVVCVAAGGGVQLRRFDIGLRYVHAKSIEGTEAGFWHDRKLSYAALDIGYNLFR